MAEVSLERNFEELLALGEIELFLAKIRGYIESKVRGKTFAGMETDDVVQEVLLKVYTAIEHYDASKGKASTYFTHIINNQIKDIYRHAGSASNLMIVNAVLLADNYDEDENENNDIVTKQVVLGEVDSQYAVVETVCDIIENFSLTEREKEIFRLRAAGYSHKEIADILCCSKANISIIWKNILRKLENFATI